MKIVDVHFTQTSAERLSTMSETPDEGQIDPCIFTITNADRLGLTEVETYHQFVHSINRLIEVEEMLASAEVVNQDDFPRQIGIDYSNAIRRSYQSF